VLEPLDIPVVADLAGVGSNLFDHPVVSLWFRARPGVRLDPAAPLRQVALRYTAGGSSWRNDTKINIQSYAPHPSPGIPVGVAFRVIMNRPTSCGRLRLVSRDPDDQPLIDLSFLGEEFDRRRLRDAVRECASLARSRAFRQILEERLAPTDAELATDAALDDWLMRDVSTSHHLAGTCKMGPPADSEAVVDQYCSVHGVGGLRVVDASIMPTPVGANTNLPTMMIAERAAELIGNGIRN
jgi:choline dehydrogenase